MQNKKQKTSKPHKTQNKQKTYVVGEYKRKNTLPFREARGREGVLHSPPCDRYFVAINKYVIDLNCFFLFS